MKESVLYNSVKFTHQLEEWYLTPAGQNLYKALQLKLEVLLPELFGYHALQIGGLADDIDLISSSKIGQKLYMTLSTKKGNVVANPLALPFPQNTLDLIVLPHTLDISPKPHQVLREIHRVMGISKAMLMRSQRAPWAAHFYTARRLKDWLSLLGFKLLTIEHVGMQPPIQNEKFQQRMQFLNKAERVGLGRLGGLQILVAKKRELTLTPMLQPWKPRRRMIPVSVPEPTARKSRNDKD